MERMRLEVLKMEENCLLGQVHPHSHPSPSLFSSLTGQGSSLFDKNYSPLQPPPLTAADLPPTTVPSSPAFGFMESLGHESFESFSSVLDCSWNLKGAGGVSSITTGGTTANNSSSGFLEASEVLNPLPSTPNSSSISSAFNDQQAFVDNSVKEEDRCWDQEDQEQEQAQSKTGKQLKPKKTNQKKQREQRFAFMTKSQVDHLEDGYRWRKYGQKAVKNSPFPRSYYRCTSTTCNVKKRVERCFNDPSIVVTTYEGQHKHPSPVMVRGGGGVAGGFPAGFLPNPGFSGVHATAFTSPGTLTVQMGGATAPSFTHDKYVNGCFPSFNFNESSLTSTAPPSSFGQGRRSCNPSGAAGLRGDNGLLHDMVPSHLYDDQ